MKLFLLVSLINISVFNAVNTQQDWNHNDVITNVREDKPCNKRLYFPGEINGAKVISKRLNNDLFSYNFVTESVSNHIDSTEVMRFIFQSTNSNSNINRDINRIRKTPVTIRVENEDNSSSSSPSVKKRVIDEIYNSSEASEKQETIITSSSNRQNTVHDSSEKTNRIPPPSLLAAIKTPLRVCEIKYAEYIKRIFPEETDTASDANDSEFNGRILAAPGEYPHMTALGFHFKNNKLDYKCGGSLISEKFVITAAHCTNLTGLLPAKVRIGDLNLMIEESYLEPQLREIKAIYVHPYYKTNSYYNDIALLELAEEVELTEFVRPIRLWTQFSIPFSTAYAMGYGATDFAKKRTNRLTNLNMTIVPNDDCDREMPKFPETERGIISSQICARDYELNRDTCQGDSGGPLQLNIRGRRRQNRLHYQLIGITSYGLHCRSGYPSIFTRVYSYLDWIEHIVWRDYFN